MKLELNLAKAQRTQTGDVSTLVDEQGALLRNSMDLTGQRKALRVQSDHAIAALMNNNLAQLAADVPSLMLMLGHVCERCKTEPGIEDFIVGAKELIEDARVVIDKSLQACELDQLRIGITMMETVCYGIFSVLGLPYGNVMQRVHDHLLTGGTLDADTMWGILEENGFKRPEQREE